SEDVSPVLVVGHNPDMEELVCMLTGEQATFPTAALARIDLPIDSWSELVPETDGALIDLWRPRELE
ncbi:MAG: hypothetical protein N2C14_06280, partial [Planctomycetales bacterium]